MEKEYKTLTLPLVKSPYPKLNVTDFLDNDGKKCLNEAIYLLIKTLEENIRRTNPNDYKDYE
jgi:hypothetical protein